MKTTTLTQRIRSPEDIQVGDYVVKIYRRYQLAPCDIERSITGEAVKPIVLYGWPYDAGEPVKVRAVCLPFLVVQSCMHDSREVIDTRQDVLTRVDKAYAKAAKPKSEKKKKGKSKKGKKK